MQGRPTNALGAHAKGANRGNIGIALMGNFEKQKPTRAQIGSLTRLVAYLAVQYDIDTARRGYLEGHSHYLPTACPGAYLKAELGQLRVRVRDETRALASARQERVPAA